MAGTQRVDYRALAQFGGPLHEELRSIAQLEVQCDADAMAVIGEMPDGEDGRGRQCRITHRTQIRKRVEVRSSGISLTMSCSLAENSSHVVFRRG